MARTFLDLQNEALHDDFDATKYRTRVKQWLNEALHRIARRTDIPELQGLYALPLVAGTAGYALPADAIRVLEVFDSADRTPLEEVTQLDIDALPVSSSEPFAFAVFNRQVVLYPTPDRTSYQLYLRYLRNAAALTNDNDTVVASMPDDYVDLLVTYARAKLFNREDDAQMAATLMADFETELGRMRADVQRPSRRVRRTPSMFAGAGGSVPTFRRPG